MSCALFLPLGGMSGGIYPGYDTLISLLTYSYSQPVSYPHFPDVQELIVMGNKDQIFNYLRDLVNACENVKKIWILSKVPDHQTLSFLMAEDIQINIVEPYYRYWHGMLPESHFNSVEWEDVRKRLEKMNISHKDGTHMSARTCFNTLRG